MQGPSFTPLESFSGGALIGLSAANMLLVHGRVAGISGLFSGAVTTREPWRIAFIAGLVAGSVINFWANPVEADRKPTLQDMHILRIIAAGVIVGAGTKLGSGCTSGHGVCGLARASKRSFAAVVMFMGVAALTAVGTWRLTNTAPTSFAVAPLRAAHSLFGLKALGAAAATLAATAAAGTSLLNVLASGATFGLGLGVSGMAQQQKVLGFLNPVSGRWDPSLAFVMAGAVAVSGAGFQIYRRRGRRPLLAEECCLPAAKEVDAPLLLGSALFGVGWGLGGLCPGPALANLSAFVIGTASGGGSALPLGLFVAAMAAGMVLTEKANQPKPQQKKTA